MDEWQHNILCWATSSSVQDQKWSRLSINLNSSVHGRPRCAVFPVRLTIRLVRSAPNCAPSLSTGREAFDARDPTSSSVVSAIGFNLTQRSFTAGSPDLRPYENGGADSNLGPC